MSEPVPPSWERAVLEKVALKALDEQRRARQWSALFKLLWFILAFMIVSIWLGWIGRPDKDSLSGPSGRHTALVDLEGVIGIISDEPAKVPSVVRSMLRNKSGTH